MHAAAGRVLSVPRHCATCPFIAGAPLATPCPGGAVPCCSFPCQLNAMPFQLSSWLRDGARCHCITNRHFARACLCTALCVLFFSLPCHLPSSRLVSGSLQRNCAPCHRVSMLGCAVPLLGAAIHLHAHATLRNTLPFRFFSFLFHGAPSQGTVAQCQLPSSLRRAMSYGRHTLPFHFLSEPVAASPFDSDSALLYSLSGVGCGLPLLLLAQLLRCLPHYAVSGPFFSPSIASHCRATPVHRLHRSAMPQRPWWRE